MSGPRTILATLLGALALSCLTACHPYGDALQGEFSAGSADPFNYPPGYRSSGGAFTREVAGTGSFTERKAFAHGAPANYYAFPFPTSLVATTGYAAPSAGADPLRIAGPASSATPSAFEFDPTDPVQDTTSCTAPANYTYDPFADEVPLDRQGNIVSALPNANFAVGGLPTWSYIPIVQRVTVTSNGEPCQGPKSDQTIATRSDVSVPLDATPNPDGTPKILPDPIYLAWALIDPGSPVYRVGQTGANSNGLGVQHWGWYRQFIVAYLDGGQVPTVDATLSNGTPVKRMVAQKLYYPRSGVTPTSGNGLGGGNEVLQFARGEAGYTPVCQVFSYTLPAGTPPFNDATALEAAAAASPAAFGIQAGAPVSAGGAITPTFIFCLQAR